MLNKAKLLEAIAYLPNTPDGFYIALGAAGDHPEIDRALMPGEDVRKILQDLAGVVPQVDKTTAEISLEGLVPVPEGFLGFLYRNNYDGRVYDSLDNLEKAHGPASSYRSNNYRELCEVTGVAIYWIDFI